MFEEQKKTMIKLDPLARSMIQKGLLTAEKVEFLVLDAQRASETFSYYIEKNSILSDDVLLQLKSDVYGVAIIDVFDVKIEDDALEMIDKHVAQEKSILPIALVDGALIVALSDPMDFKLLSDLRLMTKKNIEVRLALKSDITSVIASTYPSDLNVIDWLPDEEVVVAAPTADEDEVSDAPVVRLVATILTEAVDRKASDIHFDPQLKELVIRIRVDGELVRMQTIPKTMQHSVISRLKVISSLDITETRVPQDGRAKSRMQE